MLRKKTLLNFLSVQLRDKLDVSFYFPTALKGDLLDKETSMR